MDPSLVLFETSAKALTSSLEIAIHRSVAGAIWLTLFGNMHFLCCQVLTLDMPTIKIMSLGAFRLQPHLESEWNLLIVSSGTLTLHQ